MVAWLLRALWYRGGVWMESGKMGKWRVTACLYRISFHDDENVLKLIMVMVVQLCEYKKIELYKLKGGFYSNCIVYL